MKFYFQEVPIQDLKAWTNGPFFKDLIPLLDPNLWQLMLDEAYKSIKDGRHLTPFSQTDIGKAESEGNPDGLRGMRLFNKVLCSDRITIERAFGQLVRRWGILWLALPTGNLQEIALVQQVAVKLHNLCVDEWLCEKLGYLTEDGAAGTAYLQSCLLTFLDLGMMRTSP